MKNPNILNAINEINSVEFNQPSEWLDALKLSASIAVRENDASLINDDIVYCDLTETEYEKFKSQIKLIMVTVFSKYTTTCPLLNIRFIFSQSTIVHILFKWQ
jgi:hypothetical protein